MTVGVAPLQPAQQHLAKDVGVIYTLVGYLEAVDHWFLNRKRHVLAPKQVSNGSLPCWSIEEAGKVTGTLSMANSEPSASWVG